MAENRDLSDVQKVQTEPLPGAFPDPLPPGHRLALGMLQHLEVAAASMVAGQVGAVLDGVLVAELVAGYRLANARCLWRYAGAGHARCGLATGHTGTHMPMADGDLEPHQRALVRPRAVTGGPMCGRAVVGDDAGPLQECVREKGHEFHRTAKGFEWRNGLPASTAKPGQVLFDAQVVTLKGRLEAMAHLQSATKQKLEEAESVSRHRLRALRDIVDGLLVAHREGAGPHDALAISNEMVRLSRIARQGIGEGDDETWRTRMIKPWPETWEIQPSARTDLPPLEAAARALDAIVERLLPVLDRLPEGRMRTALLEAKGITTTAWGHLERASAALGRPPEFRA